MVVILRGMICRMICINKMKKEKNNITIGDVIATGFLDYIHHQQENDLINMPLILHLIIKKRDIIPPIVLCNNGWREKLKGCCAAPL